MPTLAQFQGCILGLAVGDALGAPFEGLDAITILQSFGPARKIVQAPPVEKLHYTDDTQMTIGLIESLLAHQTVNEDHLVSRFLANYDPRRGYGQGTRTLIAAIADKPDQWRQTRDTLFPDGGSWGNGGAMRVAPLGLLFSHDHDLLWRQAGLSAAATHAHPRAIQGAQLISLATALVAADPSISHKSLFAALSLRASDDEYRWLLSTASHFNSESPLNILGNSLEAHRSTVTAIACASLYPDHYLDAIARAIGLGNDTDTLAAMAGAIAGARLGIQAIPAHLLDLLEDQGKGKAYLYSLADQLYKLSQNL
jgi:poly(ADP-ribose) glycohydrolase ARH3